LLFEIILLANSTNWTMFPASEIVDSGSRTMVSKRWELSYRIARLQGGWMERGACSLVHTIPIVVDPLQEPTEIGSHFTSQ
jgi:hypothetical protein